MTPFDEAPYRNFYILILEIVSYWNDTINIQKQTEISDVVVYVCLMFKHVLWFLMFKHVLCFPNCQKRSGKANLYFWKIKKSA